MQLAQSVHGAFQFSVEWPATALSWHVDSNYLVCVAVQDEQSLARLAERAAEEGIACTSVREPDMNDELTAVALGPGDVARRLCSQHPLALKQVVPVMT